MHLFFDGFGSTLKIANFSLPAVSFVRSAAFITVLPPGDSSRHPFPVGRFAPRVTGMPATFVFDVLVGNFLFIASLQCMKYRSGRLTLPKRRQDVCLAVSNSTRLRLS